MVLGVETWLFSQAEGKQGQRMSDFCVNLLTSLGAGSAQQETWGPLPGVTLLIGKAGTSPSVWLHVFS